MAMINYRNCHHNLNDLFNSENTFTERKTLGGLQIIYDTNFWKYNLTIFKEHYLQIQYPFLQTTSFLNTSPKKFITKFSFTNKIFNSYWVMNSRKQMNTSISKCLECYTVIHFFCDYIKDFNYTHERMSFQVAVLFFSSPVFSPM